MPKLLRITPRSAVALMAALASWPLLAADPRPQTGIAPPTRIPNVPTPAVQAGSPVATAAVPRAVRRAVAKDAARRFGVAESAVVLSGAEQVTWRDGSLGCPQPGQMYTQALVPGFRLTATTAEGTFLYHTDSQGQVLVCTRTSG